MIQTEMIGDRIRHWSNLGFKIRQVETGILYEDAVDIPGLYTYEETDIPIEGEEISAEEALNILIGGVES